MFPMLSILMSSEASSSHFTNWSLACLSVSVSVSRVVPGPFLPILPSVFIVLMSLFGFMVGFIVFLWGDRFIRLG